MSASEPKGTDLQILIRSPHTGCQRPACGVLEKLSQELEKMLLLSWLLVALMEIVF